MKRIRSFTIPRGMTFVAFRRELWERKAYRRAGALDRRTKERFRKHYLVQQQGNFSNRPKRTHEERRLAIVPWEGPGVFPSRQDRVRCGSAGAAWADAMDPKTKRLSLRPWMKQAVYIREYQREIRRGKWVARAERGKEKRLARRGLREDRAEFYWPDGSKTIVTGFAEQVKQLAR